MVLRREYQSRSAGGSSWPHFREARGQSAFSPPGRCLTCVGVREAVTRYLTILLHGRPLANLADLIRTGKILNLFDNQPFATYLFNSNDEWFVAELIQASLSTPTETANRS